MDMTARSRVDAVDEQARSLGANAFLTKPFDIDELVRTCRGLAAA